MRYFIRLWHKEIQMYWAKRVSRETYNEMKDIYTELGYTNLESMDEAENELTLTVYGQQYQ